LGNGDPAHAKQITSGKFEGIGSLAWTPDGRIVYTSGDSGDPDIWIMRSDGSGRKQLTTDPGRDPAVSPDGRRERESREVARRAFKKLKADVQNGTVEPPPHPR